MKKNDLRTGILIGMSAIISPLILMGTMTTQTPTSVLTESHVYEYIIQPTNLGMGNQGGFLLNKKTGEMYQVSFGNAQKVKVTEK